MKRLLIDRRDFLRAAGIGFAAAVTPSAWANTLAADAVFATAFVKRDGSFGAAVLSEAGKLLHAIDLPDRGHDVTFDPISKHSVVFARQPGTFAVVFDHTGRDAPLTIASIAGRHFFGHGVFSPDGALLYATENDFDNAAGVVGVYDTRAKFKRIGEFPTYGMGPHELLLLGDGRTIAVANGGIETHPDYGRAELNIATMKPSYALVDRITGDLIEKHELPAALHQLSIRHMDTDRSGTVWFGCQYRGPGTDRPPLVGRAARGKDLALLDMPRDVLSGFRNYIGSVAANPVAGTVAVSSPEGNSLVVIDAGSGRVVSSNTLVDVCGVAPDGAGFMATTGSGEIIEGGGATRSEPDYVWDNHMLRIDEAA
ncbi:MULTISPECIES: DUF1513 domain-containing protein [unclassified Mesorhizobium]|uniref:DUF1513 domain-containing protein n=1 Tax=unclassified Mesorhizobium TaxID=325217 RepID=UPI001CCC638C|nr:MULTISPECIES: DUF1513 domain-containing protein [unclassified Mesorhizobium]MBZ9739420.1 DUF1513 domain-containing protein [Mesorhizobium sp. CO1-1-4]MBZ9801524.1 DUF1513 domain-containing protein [Mesorhizobium sp. ES1-6]